MPSNTDTCHSKFSLLYAPVLRKGAIISARFENGDRLVIPFQKMDEAIESLTIHEEKFVQAAREALEEEGWTVSFSSEFTSLRSTSSSRRLGAVVDFQEIEISRDGFTCVLRFCVTVCVDHKRKLHPKKAETKLGYLIVKSDEKKLLFSKIWVRYSDFRFANSNAVGMPIEDIANYTRLLADLATLLTKRLHAPYTLCLRHLLPTLKLPIAIVTEHWITNITIATSDQGLIELHDAAEQGQLPSTLDYDQLSPSALRAGATMNDLRAKFVPELGRVQKNIRMIARDDSLFAKALYWSGGVKNKTFMVGLACDSSVSGADEAHLRTNGWLRAPSMPLGVIVSNKMAARL